MNEQEGDGKVAPAQPYRTVARGVRNARLVFWGLVAAGFVLAVCAAYYWQRSPVAAVLGLLAAVAIGGAIAGPVWRFLDAGGFTKGIFLEAMESSPNGRLIVDPRGREVWSNSAFRDLVGAGAGVGALGQLEGLFGQEGAAQVGRLRAAVASDSSARAEMMVLEGPDAGEWRRVSVSRLVGRPGYGNWYIEDITSRRHMEQVISEEQEKLVNFVENVPIGFYSVDREGRFQFVNHVLAEWLGTTPNALLNGSARLRDFVAGAPPGGAAYSPFDDGDRDMVGEVRLRGDGGQTLYAQINQRVLRGTDDHNMVVHSVVRDLTPEREWERALSHSESKLRQYFAAAPVGIVLLDHDHRIEECNRAFTRMLGVRRLDLLGQPFVERIVAEDRKELGLRLAGAFAGEQTSATLDVRLDSLTGVVTSLYISRIEDTGGDASGLMLHLIDATEQKNLEIQFAQSQKMQAVGQLAGGVAHDFNNLLTAMIGFCDLLLLRHKPGEESFADIMQIKQNANRAANLVRQLLAFSRQQTLQPRVLNITDVLADLSNLLRRLIGANIELTTIHGRDLGLIKVDQGQLEQVIINLVVNARDAMLDGGVMTVRTSNASVEDPVKYGHELLPVGDYVLIEIEDTGMGIAAENLGRIFEPFFSTKAVGSGTGLGLSTVYGIVKQTGGYIFVKSTVSQGTTFSIFLPRYGDGDVALPRADTKANPAKDLTGVGTVLLVEDEDAVRLFSARALRNKGYKVLEANSGEGALELIRTSQDKIDVLVTDVVMPHLDGPELVKMVRATRPDMKVIFISGYAEDAFRQRIGSESELHFLPKPFSLQQLAGKVKDVMVGPTA